MKSKRTCSGKSDFYSSRRRSTIWESRIQHGRETASVEVIGRCYYSPLRVCREKYKLRVFIEKLFNCIQYENVLYRNAGETKRRNTDLQSCCSVVTYAGRPSYPANQVDLFVQDCDMNERITVALSVGQCNNRNNGFQQKYDIAHNYYIIYNNYCERAKSRRLRVTARGENWFQ